MKYILVVDGQNIAIYNDRESALEAQENFELSTYERTDIVEVKS